jgi:Flp pilus assembly protein TadD
MSRTKRARRHAERSLPLSSEPVRAPRLPRWFGVALLALTALVYAPSLGNGFTYDDPSVVSDASELLSHPRLAVRLFTPDYFTLSGESTFRPIVTLTYILDWQVGGGQAWAFHLQSLLWHLFTVGCLVVLLSRLGAGPFVAAATSAIYAVHPALTEAVDAIAFREDVLATAFGVLGLVTLTGTWPRSAAARLVIGTGCFAAALFSKESGLVFVALLPLTHWAIQRRAEPRDPWHSRHLGQYVAVALCVVAYLVVRFGLLPAPGRYGIDVSDSLSHSAATGIVAVGHYLFLVLWPSPLCPDYRGVVAYVTSLADWRLWTSAMAVAGLSVFAWRRRQASPLIWWGWAWFLISLVPVLNLVPIPMFMAERFLYLPYVGLVTFAVGSLVPRQSWPSRPMVAATVTILCVFSGLTWMRHRAWSSNESLWRATLDDFPNAPGALHGYGSVLVEAGRYVEAVGYFRRVMDDPGIGPDRRAVVARELGFAQISLGQVAEAITSYEASLAATPTSMAHQNLALVLLRLDRLQEAETHMRAALQLQPDEAEAHSGLGAVLARQGRHSEAIDAYRDAIRLRPTLAVAHANLGVALAAEGRSTEATTSLLQAITLEPEQPRWRYRVAILLEAQGRRGEAIQQLQAALRIDPDDAETRDMLAQISR